MPKGSGAPSTSLKMARASSDTGFLPFVVPLALIVAETAIFSIFVVAYIFYIGKGVSGPQPGEVLRLPVFATICLLSSSVTIHLAVKFLRTARVVSFSLLWGLTFALGAIFLGANFIEWRHLIFEDGLTIQTNLFGTTCYSLVGPACLSRDCGADCSSHGFGFRVAR